MILILHIAIALASVALSTYAFFSPSRRLMHTSYGLVAATLASGTALVIASHANILSACTTGLFYTLSVSALLYAGNRKLAAQKVTTRK